MRALFLTVLCTTLLSTGAGIAMAAPQPFYNPTNPASPTGYTTGYKLYRTIGCPGKQLLANPGSCANAPLPGAKAAAPAPKPAAPAPKPAAPAPKPVAAAPQPAPAPAPAAKPAPAPLTHQAVIKLQGVLFDFDSSKLRPASHVTLDHAAEVLKKNHYPAVEVDGYTDSTGPAAYNLKLSNRRAQAVRNYLIGKGCPADKLTTKGFGETHPVASNKTRAGRQQNRRVELVVQ